MATESLYVNGYDWAVSNWNYFGAEPWLGDNDDYVYREWAGLHGWFSFADNAIGAGAIGSVVLYLECMRGAGDSKDITVSIQATGVVDKEVGDITPDLAYSWKTIDVSADIDTWAKIDSCEMKVNKKVPDAAILYVRRAYLLVTYGAAGLSIPVAMYHYNRINKIIRG